MVAVALVMDLTEDGMMVRRRFNRLLLGVVVLLLMLLMLEGLFPECDLLS